MSTFFLLLGKIVILYTLILLGYIAGKRLKVNKEAIAPLLIFIVAPAVFFYGSATVSLNISIISLPILFYIIGATLCLVFYVVGKQLWTDGTKNILAFTAGDANTGYFGLPVALALFGKEALGLVIFCNMGLLIYENTLGFYMVARGQHTVRESLLKMFKLPTIYAFTLGILVNSFHLTLPVPVQDLLTKFTGAYTILGMMLIGIALSQMTKSSFDLRLLGTSFLAKFILWPAIMLGVIWLDQTYFHLYSQELYHIMFLLSLMPLAVNTVAYATHLKTHPEKAAFIVLMSTLFVLFYIPLMVSLYLS